MIGNGVALNIPVLCNEIKSITDQGVPMPKILVSDRAQIVMPYHILFDQYEEERLGKASFGSTKSGIAPFYSDKYAKIGYQVSELFDDELLKEKVERTCETKNVLLEHLYHKPLLNPDELYVAEIYANQGPTMKRFRASDHGRASMILKRTSHIAVTLRSREDAEQKVEGGSPDGSES